MTKVTLKPFPPRPGDEQIARRVCARLARGSISLQLGRYVTTAQHAARRENLRNYRFANEG